jgi:chitinase
MTQGRTPPTPTTTTAPPSSSSPPAMVPSSTAVLLVCIVTLALPLSLAASPPVVDARETVLAGYYLAADARLLPVAALDASLYTHLYYSALAVDPTARALVRPADPDQARLLAAFSRELRSRNRALRTLLSFGAARPAAWASTHQTDDEPALAATAADPPARAALAASAVALARAHGFDGLDVAWRFPASAAEMAGLGLLVADLRAAAPRGFLLTATVYFADHVFGSPGADYPSEALARALDWVNVIAFGLRRAPANVTAFDAPLYDAASHFSASYGVVSWADAGVPPGKLVLGLPLYGRSWFLRNKADASVGAPIVAAGPKQRGTNATGIMSYAELQRLAAAGTGQRAVTTTYDNASVASYLSVGGVWVAFDGAAVVDEKLAFAARRGMRGYFLWPVNYDDANFTVSRRGRSVTHSHSLRLILTYYFLAASEAWMHNQISSNSSNRNGVRQTEAPVRVPPALQSAPTPTPGPMRAPTSACCSWRKLHLFLYFGLLVTILV